MVSGQISVLYVLLDVIDVHLLAMGEFIVVSAVNL